MATNCARFMPFQHSHVVQAAAGRAFLLPLPDERGYLARHHPADVLGVLHEECGIKIGGRLPWSS